MALLCKVTPYRIIVFVNSTLKAILNRRCKARLGVKCLKAMSEEIFGLTKVSIKKQQKIKYGNVSKFYLGLSKRYRNFKWRDCVMRSETNLRTKLHGTSGNIRMYPMFSKSGSRHKQNFVSKRKYRLDSRTSSNEYKGHSASTRPKSKQLSDYIDLEVAREKVKLCEMQILEQIRLDMEQELVAEQKFADELIQCINDTYNGVIDAIRCCQLNDTSCKTVD